MKIKLKDNTELTVTESSTATKITADFSSAEDIENFRKKLTDENLSAFRYIKDDTDEIIGEYKNYTFETVSYLYSEEKSVFEATFNIRQLSNIEVRIAAVEAWQTTQNDAIAEMSEVIYSEQKGVDEMAKFWSERIAYDLNRIDEVPAKLREKVKKYIEQHSEA